MEPIRENSYEDDEEFGKINSIRKELPEEKIMLKAINDNSANLKTVNLSERKVN